MKYIGWSRQRGHGWRSRVSSPDSDHCLKLLMMTCKHERFVDMVVLAEGRNPNDKPAKAPRAQGVDAGLFID